MLRASRLHRMRRQRVSPVAPKTPKAVGVVADGSAEKRDVGSAPPQPPVTANDLQSERTEAGAEINA